MSWNKSILTIQEVSDYVIGKERQDNEGVTFRSHLDGTLVN